MSTPSRTHEPPIIDYPEDREALSKMFERMAQRDGFAENVELVRAALQSPPQVADEPASKPPQSTADATNGNP
ncbi:MAG: hypothetical protein AB7O59_23500 [Pirellulales bacterium]